MMVPSLDDLIQQAEYQQHPYGQVWQRLDPDTFEEMSRNVDRRGLDREIILYDRLILEGWHRYLACLAAKVQPRFTEFKGSNLEAAELVHASGIRRHSSPDQRYASFILLCDACPEFKAKYEKLKAKGEHQQKVGKPLDTGAQRVDVVQAKAEAAGVSKTTAKKVERVMKGNPAAVPEIAAGTTTANKALKKTQARKKPRMDKASPESTGHSRHNYKLSPNTKIKVAEELPESPGNFLVTMNSLLAPSGYTVHDLAIHLDRKQAEALRHQIDEALTARSDHRPAQTTKILAQAKPKRTAVKSNGKKTKSEQTET
jgi:hypothetical protein